MKYDELTLMKFVDGELDETLTAEIESARTKDKDLQSHIEIYETTRSALIESTIDEEIPSHIIDMIDNYSPVKKQNWLTKIVKNNPLKSSIFSAIIASIVTFQGLLIVTGGMFTTSQFATRGIEANPAIEGQVLNIDSEGKVIVNSSLDDIFSRGLIEEEINKALSINQNIAIMDIKIGSNLITLYFLERFTDNSGNNCKVAQIADQFLIVCKADESPWAIRSY